MAKAPVIINRALLVFAINLLGLLLRPSSAQLRQNYYANICPNVESIVRNAVTAKLQQTTVTVPGTLRLFFHDCFVNGCDASVIVASTASNTAKKDNSINLSLAGDGFDTVIKAKAAVDVVELCRNKVSCADILNLNLCCLVDHKNDQANLVFPTLHLEITPSALLRWAARAAAGKSGQQAVAKRVKIWSFSDQVNPDPKKSDRVMVGFSCHVNS